ncbi:MAG: AI-2E family transporter [Solirubrobacterales bacterium]|nr:AI-2E family transporter [Solirubrobacterales bacterium]
MDPTAPKREVVVSARTVAKVFLVALGLSAVCYFLVLARQALGLVIISIFLAVALGPAVGFFENRSRIPRWLSIIVVYLLVMSAIVLIGLIVVPPIVTGVQQLAEEIPIRVEELKRTGWILDLDNRYNVVDKLGSSVSELPQQLGTAAGTLQAVTLGALSAFVQLVTVLTLVFLWLLDGPRIVHWLSVQFSGDQKDRINALASDMYRVVSGYVVGNFVISVAAGSVTYVTLITLGIPFAAPLAIFMAFMDLIPMVGATIGGAIVGLASIALGDFPWDPIIWLIVLTAYQQVENNLLQPVIYKRTVAVPPILTIIAVLIGAALLGVLGVLLAIPVAAMLQVLASDVWPEVQKRREAARAKSAVSSNTVPAAD